MARIVECDACKKTCACEKAYKVQVCKINAAYTKGGKLFEVDVCPDCYEHVKEVLRRDK